MKKVFALLLAAMLLVSMTACNSTENQSGNGKYTIGICQLVQHPALDKATEGFIAAVEAGLGKENVTFKTENASGETTNCMLT